MTFVISGFQQQSVCHMLTTQHNSFLYTVSRLVSSRDIRRRGSEEEGGRLLHVTDPDPTIKPKSYPKPPVMQTLFYIHVIAFFAILTFCWLDTLPGIGRVSNAKRNMSMSSRLFLKDFHHKNLLFSIFYKYFFILKHTCITKKNRSLMLTFNMIFFLLI